MKTIVAILSMTLAAAAFAQETVAPTVDENVGPVRGENAGAYNVVQSWELGYRFATVGGNRGAYRADVNYGNGLRLLASSLTVNSKDGHGRWFDEIVLTTQGLGNDPYESANVRIRKNRVYEYSLSWRQNDYFNPGLIVADGEHFMNTRHRWQDHDLLLFPRGHFRILGGYSRVAQTGPALTTEQEFDGRGSIFPLFRNIRREYNEFRTGGDIDYPGFRFHFLHRWELFKEDTTDNLGFTITGEQATLSNFARSEPYHGYTGGWLASLYAERSWFAVNARLAYSGGSRNFVLNEGASGLDRFGAAQNRQVVVSGDASRPFTTGNFNVTLFPGARWNVINDTSVSTLRIVGNNTYSEFDNATLSASVLNFQFLGIRLITNATDVRYRVRPSFDVFGGFRYSDRLIRSDIATALPGSPFDCAIAEQTNRLKAGSVGFNWLPFPALRLHAEAEIGRADNPFTPVSERNYHAIQTRAQYRKKTVSLSAAFVENYNTNSIVVTSYSSHARTYSADASWSGRSWLSLDASYTRLHLDTAGGLAFFAGTPFPTLVTGVESLYVSNIHSGHLGVRLGLGKFADLSLGYAITRDAGDGRPSLIRPADSVSAIFGNVQTFPLTFQSPYARLSLKLNSKLRWNAGYQWYGYGEEFGLLDVNQNYRAHTGYTSLLWAF